MRRSRTRRDVLSFVSPQRRCRGNMIADLWKRYEAWLAAHAPAVLAALSPPARPDAIDAFERELGWRLPDDLRTSFLVHDGERRDGPGVIAGMLLNSIADLANDWRRMEQLRVAGTFEPVVVDSVRVEALEAAWPGSEDKPYDYFETVAKIRTIEARAQVPLPTNVSADHAVIDVNRRPGEHAGLWEGHWHRGWLPIASDGGGDSWSLDVDPAPGGVIGQIVYFDHEVGSTPVLYPSFTAWFGHYLEQVDAGRVRVVVDMLELDYERKRGFGA
jgi:cell wall assembly regulator SMI1